MKDGESNDSRLQWTMTCPLIDHQVPSDHLSALSTSSKLQPAVSDFSSTSIVTKPNNPRMPTELRKTTSPRPPASTGSSSPKKRISPPSSPVDRHNLCNLDLAGHPTSEIVVMLASLLNKIINANDQLNHHAHNIPSSTGTPPSQMMSSILCFHARNIPTIDVLSYLNRIFKYCPTTNDVFLSLLVYFDRMSKFASSLTGQPFAIDSYNIHRLIIAGITVASKFFSDIFYTNSRYAKVGGLPVQELNQLEIQFLLLNDFRLMIPLEELQRYGDQLLKYWHTESSDDINSNIRKHEGHPPWKADDASSTNCLKWNSETANSVQTSTAQLGAES